MPTQFHLTDGGLVCFPALGEAVWCIPLSDLTKQEAIDWISWSETLEEVLEGLGFQEEVDGNWIKVFKRA
jgi:hypothetical protein